MNQDKKYSINSIKLIIRNIVEIYPHFYPSQTQLKNYFKIQNISKECFLQLSYIQYKYLDDLLAK